MSQQPSGWYDDPSSPDMLRYWDGVSWTTHTAPRQSPTASPSTMGMPQQPPQQSGPSVPVAPTAPMPQGSGWQTQGPQQGGVQYPGTGQYPQAPQNANWMHDLRTSADGVPLASWGRRFGAWLIDGVLLVILTYFLLTAFAPGYFDSIEQFVNAAGKQDQRAVEAAITELADESVRAGLIAWLTTAFYCIAFWTTTAQTPGKMAVGISVRRVSEPGPLDFVTALKRRLLSVLQIIPLVSAIYFIIWLLDGLWPLWDDKRQALHDKVAKTQVVMGKQPRKP